MVVCNTLPETNELVSPNAGGGASGCVGAAGAGAAGVGGASGIDVAGTGATGVETGSAGAVLLDVSGVLVEAAGVALGYTHHFNTASIKILKAINYCAPSTPSTPKSPSP
jgi:hypothetical protein